MKNTYLKFIFYSFILLLWIVFSSNLVGNSKDFNCGETLVVQDWECDCAEDAAECLVLCLDQDNCCCEITWEFSGTTPPPVPTYCKESDIATDCFINNLQCNVQFSGEDGELCTSTFDYPNNPYYLRPSFFCLEASTSLYINNPSTTQDIQITIRCKGNNPGGPHSYVIPAGHFRIITLSGCNPNNICPQ
nr:hypothetical protein [Saprospiraceae bacterium]